MKAKKQVSGKIISKPKKKVTKRITKTFTIKELEDALFEAERDFESAMLKIMLLGETLRSIKEDNLIKGKKIELGLFKRRLTKEVRGWFKEFGYTIGDKLITKEFYGVPIEIKIIKKKYSFFQHLDTVWYKAFEAFDIPNPWKKYYKVRGIVK